MNKLIDIMRALSEGEVLMIIILLIIVILVIFLLFKAITSFNYQGMCYDQVVNITTKRNSNDSTSSTSYLINFTTNYNQNIISIPLNNGGFKK